MRCLCSPFSTDLARSLAEIAVEGDLVMSAITAVRVTIIMLKRVNNDPF